MAAGSQASVQTFRYWQCSELGQNLSLIHICRQLYLAQSLAGDGYPVYTSCLGEGSPPGCLGSLPPAELAARCGILLLPLPAARNGVLNAPLAPAPIPLDEDFVRLLLGKQVYGGMLSPLRAASPLWEQVESWDYYTREELLLGNAFLTAEGAVGLAIHEYEDVYKRQARRRCRWSH